MPSGGRHGATSSQRSRESPTFSSGRVVTVRLAFRPLFVRNLAYLRAHDNDTTPVGASSRRHPL